MASTTLVSPLRRIIGRPADLLEELECGHVITRPVSLGEPIQEPSKAKRRRCYKCAEASAPPVCTAA